MLKSQDQIKLLVKKSGGEVSETAAAAMQEVA